jgi:polysaccharide export outer membrane protein
MFIYRILASVGLFGAVAAMGGCAWMPANGPSGDAVVAGQQDPTSIPYALVKVTPEAERVLAYNAPRLGRLFRDTRPPTGITFGVNDILSVTIFEAAAGGLFIPSEAGVRPGNFVNIPNQPIDTEGNITIPYAGKIRAAGRTPIQVQTEIENALKNRAIEPQAIVAIVNQNSSLLTVLGDVGTPSRFPANYNAEHILDTIARAGGVKGNGFDVWVMLERDHKRDIVPFGALLYEPEHNNIWTHPNDTIFVYTEPQTFVAFGATGNQGQMSFGAWRISLAEAVAKSGGLSDSSAEPGYVFLYRGETRDVAEQLGIDCSKYSGPIIPIIYNANFRDPAAYFLATRFQMRNKDVLYISNSTSFQATKAMGFFNTVMATASNPISFTTNVYSLKGIIQGTTNTVLSNPSVTTTTTPVTPTTTTTTTSDIRLKHDITLLGRLDNGLGFYRFIYNGDNKAYVGVMAQEVEAVMPDAVVTGPDGYLRVRYDKLGLKFESYDDWIASGAKIPASGLINNAP